MERYIILADEEAVARMTIELMRTDMAVEFKVEPRDGEYILYFL